MVTGCDEASQSAINSERGAEQAHNRTSVYTSRSSFVCLHLTQRTHAQGVERNMPQWREQKVQSEGCNRAVVVSVAQFDPGVSLGRRPGAKKDAKKIHSTLSKLGFKVEYHMDLSGDEIYELFQKGARTSFSFRRYTSTYLFVFWRNKNAWHAVFSALV